MATLQPPSERRRVLVFHIGSLGDTLVALPAFWAVHDAFPRARRVMLTKTAARAAIPVGPAILEGSGLFHAFMMFEGDYHEYGKNPPLWRKLWGALRLLLSLRRERFDLAVYLAPSQRNADQIKRDVRFFKWAGIREVIGAEVLPVQSPVKGMPASQRAEREAQMLLKRVAGSELRPAPLAQLRHDLALGAQDHALVDAWTARQASDGGRRWIAVAPGSNMQSKLWPEQRYEEAVRRLIERYDVWPVVFGGAEDVEAGRRLVQAWGRGWNAASAFSVRGSAAALERCLVYVGNDTGTMHLAASAGVPCVAMFAARDVPGKWEPLGPDHVVLRKDVPCSGCMLVKCEEQDRLCLRLIDVDEVVESASTLISRRWARARTRTQTQVQGAAA